MNAAWTRALREHDAVVADFLRAIDAVPDTVWQQPPAPGKWTPAALALHVSDAYRFGCDAATNGTGMKLRVPPFASFLSRTIVFRLMLLFEWFPRNAPVPPEVRPDLTTAQQLSKDAARVLLVQQAAAAQAALSQPTAHRVQHAVFGSLSPQEALRMLSAHTRHHTAGMRARAATIAI